MNYPLADPETYAPSKHSAVVMDLGALLVDLKLQLLGDEPTMPITMDRLAHCSRLVASLSECKEVTQPRYLR